MRLNYKKLGNYIELVSCLNTKLQYGEVDVRGVSNNKQIIQTRANNEGRDFNTFYLVEPYEFIYNSRTSRMGDKVGLGYNDTKKTFITSFNNTVFRVKNEALLPMYLFMWFNRPEFDRYVRFHSWGSSTEIFSWEEMCNTQLPIPSITKQREIIKEYNTIQNRIALNQQLIQKLEEAAQAIYKQWFVEFEFPDENGKPYKSNGGEMVWCEELGKEIPLGWEVGKLGKVLDCNPETLSNKDNFDKILYLDTSNITNNKIYELQGLDLEKDEIPSRARRKVKTNDIIFSTVRPALKHYGIIKNLPENLIVSTGFAVFRVKLGNIFPELVYSFLTDVKIIEFLQAKAEMSVSTYPSITSDDITNLDFVLPEKRVLDLARDVFKSKDDFINLKNKENQKLTELQELLLSRLATVE